MQRKQICQGPLLEQSHTVFRNIYFWSFHHLKCKMEIKSLKVLGRFERGFKASEKEKKCG